MTLYEHVKTARRATLIKCNDHRPVEQARKLEQRKFYNHSFAQIRQQNIHCNPVFCLIILRKCGTYYSIFEHHGNQLK